MNGRAILRRSRVLLAAAALVLATGLAALADLGALAGIWHGLDAALAWLVTR